jgi:hypothetical protein
MKERMMMYLPMNISLILLCLLAAVWCIVSRNRSVATASGTGMTYIDGFLVKDRPGKDAVAQRLKNLQRNIVILLEYAESNPGDFACDGCVRRIRQRWSGTVSEIKSNKENIAYTENKRNVYVCIRGSNGDLDHVNTCMYTLLHELAHICTDDWGHTDTFWDNFKFLLELAVKAGVYRYTTYTDETTYCGHFVGRSPLSCVNTKKCTSELSQRQCTAKNNF